MATWGRTPENRTDFPEPKPEQWLKEEQAVALKEFVMAGNGFYSLHNNSHVSLSSKTYRDVQGGAYIGHPPLRPFQVRSVNPSHPVTQGPKPFIANDEQHYRLPAGPMTTARAVWSSPQSGTPSTHCGRASTRRCSAAPYSGC